MTTPSNWTTVRIRQINELFQRHLGRLPDSGELDMHLNSRDANNVPTSINSIEAHIQNTDEYYRRTNTPQYSTDLGMDTTAFGGADYIEALIRGGEYNTQRTRQDVLSWLTNIHTGQRYLNPNQRPGQTTASGRASLYDLIEGLGDNRSINTAWGDYNLYPDAGEWFGQADLLATRAMGFSEQEIQDYLDENPSVLRDQNRPGVSGGVYEAVRSGTPIRADAPSPNITRNPVEFEGRNPLTIERDDRLSLAITPDRTGPGTGRLPAGTGGVRRRSGNPRPKYTSTKDLSREARNSLNIMQ